MHKDEMIYTKVKKYSNLYNHLYVNGTWFNKALNYISAYIFC